MGCKLLNNGEEVIKDYLFKQFIKNILSLGLLDGLSSFITLVFLIFSYLTNIKDIPKD